MSLRTWKWPDLFKIKTQKKNYKKVRREKVREEILIIIIIGETNSSSWLERSEERTILLIYIDTIMSLRLLVSKEFGDMSSSPLTFITKQNT